MGSKPGLSPPLLTGRGSPEIIVPDNCVSLEPRKSQTCQELSRNSWRTLDASSMVFCCDFNGRWWMPIALKNLPVPRFCGIFRAMCPLRFAWETNTWITHPAAPITRAPQKKRQHWMTCSVLALESVPLPGASGEELYSFGISFRCRTQAQTGSSGAWSTPVCVLTKMAWAKVGTRQTTHSCHCCCRPAFHVPVPPPLNHSAQCLCLAKMAPSGSPLALLPQLEPGVSKASLNGKTTHKQFQKRVCLKTGNP